MTSSAGQALAEQLARAFDHEHIFKRNNLIADPWQENLLRAEHSHYILNCSRRSGKSETVSALAGQWALTKPFANVLISAPSERQVKELLRSIFRLIDGAGYSSEIKQSKITEIEFNNGSRILAVPGGNPAGIRGYGADLLVIDEAAFCDDELYSALSPVIATNPKAKMILLSTPAAKEGFFFRLWSGEDSHFEKIKITADECPRIPPEFLERQKKEMSAAEFAREYLCEFADDLTQFLSPEIVESAFRKGLGELVL